jgi:hypothetical protein
LKLNEGVEEDLWRYIHLMQLLGEKLGPVLIQLRPMFNYDSNVGDLEKFLEILPRNQEWAVEFRHQSWLRNETYKLLSKHNVAYTIVDEPLLPPEEHVTADFAYIRWHGHGRRIWYDYEYNKEQLETWKPKVEKVQKKAKRTYGYFNNHFNANAVKNAVELLQMLDSATPEQENALTKIKEHRAEVRRPAAVQSLTAYRADEEGLNVSDLLVRFTDLGRLSRAEQITESVQVYSNSSNGVKARIRNYNIEIDLIDKVIRHDCDDWKKSTSKKRMCKHVNRLFLTLPTGQAQQILESIWENRDDWTFE